MHSVETINHDDGCRPGFAKRTLDPTTCSPSIAINLTAYEVQQAIALGLSHLTAQERDLLQFYTAFLNLTHLKDGKTSVWPSSRLACKLLGISAATLRRYKASLEHKGYLLRRYDSRNRPLEQGAIDLAPLLTQVKGLLKNIQKQYEAQKAYYHSLSEESDEGSSVQEVSAYPLTREHHKHINSINSFFVPKTRDKRQEEGQSDNCVDQVLNVSAIRELIEMSEVLTAHFADFKWAGVNALKIWDRLNTCVLEIFPNGSRCVQPWGRAKKRFGIQALELLVVSLEDPKFKDGAKFLGFMAFSWKGDLNLKPNLRRVIDIQKKFSENQGRILLAKELRRKSSAFTSKLLSDEALLSWFRNVRVDEEQEVITIWVENEFVKSRVKADYLPIIQIGCTKEIKVSISCDGN